MTLAQVSFLEVYRIRTQKEILHVDGIAGVVSIDLLYPIEKLRTMLTWFDPGEGKDLKKIDIIQHKNSCMGIHGDYAIYTSPKGTIKAALAGRLLHKEPLLQRLKELNLPTESEDGAILASLFQELREKTFELLNGDFVALILDIEKDELLIARDRVGTFDLYWYIDNQGLLFSSSLKALLGTGLIPQGPDLEALAGYLFNGYISQDKTPIQGVNRLIPGYFLRYSLSGSLLVQPYWSFSHAFTKSHWHHVESYEELYSELNTKIHTAITSRSQDALSCPSILSGSFCSDIAEQILLEKNPAVPRLHAYFTQSPGKLQFHEHTVEIGPKTFLDTLVPMVFAMEMPIAEVDHLRAFHYAEWCSHHNLKPFFCTGFESEFQDYGSAHVLRMPQKNHRESRLFRLLHTLDLHLSQITSALFPKAMLRMLRKSESYDPRIHFLEERALQPISEFKKLSPSLSRYFSPDLFLHQFYHLPRILSGPASLFYLVIKTEVMDKLHAARSTIALWKGLSPETPFLDVSLLEFLASLDETVWASPDILPSFPAYIADSLGVTTKKEPNSHSALLSWMENREVRKTFTSLTKGLLADCGFIAPEAVKILLERKNIASFRTLYALLILEIWMRLFIDRPVTRANERITLQDLMMTAY